MHSSEYSVDKKKWARVIAKAWCEEENGKTEWYDKLLSHNPQEVKQAFAEAGASIPENSPDIIVHSRNDKWGSNTGSKNSIVLTLPSKSSRSEDVSSLGRESSDSKIIPICSSKKEDISALGRESSHSKIIPICSSKKEDISTLGCESSHSTIIPIC